MQLYKCDNVQYKVAILKTFDPVLVAVCIAIESNFNPIAESKAHAWGLMQIVPTEELPLSKIKDPIDNIRIGSQLLEWRIVKWKSVDLAFASFNAGDSWVPKAQKYGYGILPDETQKHIKKVRKLLKEVNYNEFKN
jgi:soluble lytic murein transglycosylase-like protein